MRISEIKAMTDDYRVKGCLSALWEIACYRQLLSSYTQLDSLETLFCGVRDLYVSRFLDPVTRAQMDNRVEKGVLEDLSKCLFGCRRQWRIGTELEAVWAEQQALRAGRAERRERLSYLYARLNLTPGGRYDVVPLLARSKDLYEVVTSHEQETPLQTRSELYRLCESAVLPHLKDGTLRFPEFSVMCSLSNILCGDAFAWVTRNGMDPAAVREMVHMHPSAAPCGPEDGTASETPTPEAALPDGCCE